MLVSRETMTRVFGVYVQGGTKKGYVQGTGRMLFKYVHYLHYLQCIYNIYR